LSADKVADLIDLVATYTGVGHSLSHLLESIKDDWRIRDEASEDYLDRGL